MSAGGGGGGARLPPGIALTLLAVSPRVRLLAGRALLIRREAVWREQHAGYESWARGPDGQRPGPALGRSLLSPPPRPRSAPHPPRHTPDCLGGGWAAAAPRPAPPSPGWPRWRARAFPRGEGCGPRCLATTGNKGGK